MSGEATAKGRYEKLRVRREPFLIRARLQAALTIPSVLPPIGHSPASPLPQPWQGLGARGVSNIANRLTMAFLPAGSNHFRLGVAPKVLAKQGMTSVPTDIAGQLAQLENLVQYEVDRLNWRQVTGVTMIELLITGNCLEHMLPDNTLRTLRLDQYVVCRDHAGTLTEIVIDEELSKHSLSPNLLSLLAAEAEPDSHRVHLFTWIRCDPDGDGSWEVHQELEDKIVPGSEGTYKPDALPFWPLRWAAVIGEDYGRAKVEELYPDLRTLDGLVKAVKEGAAMASRNITMIRPNAAGGLNLRRRITQANNGELVIGNPDDVGMLEFKNANGMQFAAAEVERLVKELGAAFMLGSAMTRDAERVTATELRQNAEELDGALGGVYSMLSQEMSLPRLKRLIFQMQAGKELPDTPPGMVEPTLLVGIEALGRERDMQRIQAALSLMQNIPPEIAQSYPKWSDILDRAFIAAGLPECVRSDQEVQQMQEREAAIQALQNAAPTVAGKVLDNGQPTQPGQPPGPAAPPNQ